MTNSISPLLAVVGPTASGKSALALHLACQFDGEIVNCDSLQIYKGMDIGTAKPALDERSVVPHHLFDIRTPSEVFTAGEYSRLTRLVLREITERQHLPIVTGGAGFYLKALLEGLFPGPERSSVLRDRLAALEARRAGSLHRILHCWDPPSAARIHANDTNKLIRALEVTIHENQPLTQAHQRQRGQLEGFRVLKLGLWPDRTQLRAQIAKRSQLMFDQGLLSEVGQLRELGYGPEAKAMESVGYKQAQAVLDGRMGLQAAIEETTIRTSQYAKRQMTWFRRDPEIIWLSGFGNEPAIQQRAASALAHFLSMAIEKSSTPRNELS
ncbi:tRNA (adenosine(37)-N6)-dimethylallyltransferase MiaA [Bryobacter aggregatus]|uniref:tRNA (adenosine(37)-N6)-dimethylallyltransferase MiaA n=1 Tax=Bryobacter aggregatus TaxID=360054 RepID=UPI001EE2C30F|nr:tRNA (adenosine(37)-N6)-dimethylallyltransferase MiaA [Bryobacter aggregatus]